MNTLLIIVLTALVIGFIYRALKLYELIKRTLYYLSLNKEMTQTMMGEQRNAVGCIGLICFPCILFFFITPFFLLIKVDWWIPVVSIFAGLTVGNWVGYLIERVFQLPNHQTFDHRFSNQNAIELTLNDGRLYRRAIVLLLLYCIVAFIISLIIIFSL